MRVCISLSIFRPLSLYIHNFSTKVNSLAIRRLESMYKASDLNGWGNNKLKRPRFPVFDLTGTLFYRHRKVEWQSNLNVQEMPRNATFY